MLPPIMPPPLHLRAHPPCNHLLLEIAAILPARSVCIATRLAPLLHFASLFLLFLLSSSSCPAVLHLRPGIFSFFTHHCCPDLCYLDQRHCFSFGALIRYISAISIRSSTFEWQVRHQTVIKVRSTLVEHICRHSHLLLPQWWQWWSFVCVTIAFVALQLTGLSTSSCALCSFTFASSAFSSSLSSIWLLVSPTFFLAQGLYSFHFFPNTLTLVVVIVFAFRFTCQVSSLLVLICWSSLSDLLSVILTHCHLISNECSYLYFAFAFILVDFFFHSGMSPVCIFAGPTCHFHLHPRVLTKNRLTQFGRLVGKTHFLHSPTWSHFFAFFSLFPCALIF